MSLGAWVLWLAAAEFLNGASTGGFRFANSGALTADKAEVVSGTRSIKGRNSGPDPVVTFFSSDPNSLRLQRGETYQLTYKYKILIPGSNFPVGFFSSTAYNQGKSWPSTVISGPAGTTGEGKLTATLDTYDDYSPTWWISGQGAIAIDDIQVLNLTTGQIVASEDAEPGTLLLSTFFVSATRTSFVWGEAVKVNATLADETGQLRAAAGVTWTVNPPEAAVVEADGTVTPRALQIFVVRGTAGGKSGEVKLQARPRRIVVVPETRSMSVGSTQKMRADVLDVDDRPIANARVEWIVSSQFSSSTPSATIDQSGMLKGVMQARVRVVARIPYPGTLPGFETLAQGDALVDIKAPGTYRFERIFVLKSSGAPSSTLAPRPAQLVPTETGGFMFAASLDGMGGGLLEWSEGGVRPLLASGRTNQSGLPLTDIVSYVRTPFGEILTQEGDAAGRSLVSRGQAGLIIPLFSDFSPLVGAEQATYFVIGRNSLADTGAILVAANFTDSVTRKSGTGLFRGNRRNLSEAVVTTIDDRLDPADVPRSFVFGYGVAGDGTAWFESWPQGVIWRGRPGAAPKKMLAPGDTLGDATVRGIAYNSTGALNFFVASNGDAIAGVATDKGSRYLLWHDGDTAPSETLNVPAGGLFWYDPAVGALIDTNSTRGRGLYLWSKAGLRALLPLNDTSLDGSPVEEILSATCTGNGTIYVMARTTDNPMLIARLAPNPQVLLKAGDRVPVSVPPVISALIPGARSGTPLVIAGGQTGSVARLDENGVVTPIVRAGDRLPDRKYFTGTRLNQVRTVPDGRIVFSPALPAQDSGIYTWNAGVLETVRLPRTNEAGQALSWAGSIEVNTKGDLFAVLNGTGYGVYSIRDGRAITVALNDAVIDGIAFSGLPNVLALDDTGKLMFSVARSGGAGSYLGLWDGAESHIVLTPDTRMPDGRTVGNVGNPKACADGFVAAALGTYIRFRNGSWEYLAERSETLASGEPANSLTSFFDANRSCDVAFRGGSNGGGIGARLASKFHQLQNLNELTDDGDLLNVVQLLMNDDGTVYVLAGNDRGEEVIYRGTPLQ